MAEKNQTALLSPRFALAKLVACADKFHNLSNTLRDIENEGVEQWKSRMATTPNGVVEKQVWYYLGCLKALSASWAHPLLAEYGRAVIRLCKLVGHEEDVTSAINLAGR